MRINIYGEELTTHTAVIRKTDEKTNETYIGLRMYLATPFELRNKEGSKDTEPAITFWIKDPQRYGEHRDVKTLTTTLRQMITMSETLKSESNETTPAD